MLVHFAVVQKFALVKVLQQVLMAVVEVVAIVADIVADIVAIDVDIAAVADSSSMVGAIVLYIVEDPVVDSIGMEVPVVVDSIDTGFVVAKHAAKHVAKHVATHVAKHVVTHVATHVVDSVNKGAVAGMFYKAEVVPQDKRDMMDMGDREDRAGMEDKENMIWERAEEMAFYISGVDTILDEWATVQNYNYHNILHSILAYIYRYHNIFHNNLYCIYLVCNTFCNDSCLICSLHYNPGSI